MNNELCIAIKDNKEGIFFFLSNLFNKDLYNRLHLEKF